MNDRCSYDEVNSIFEQPWWMDIVSGNSWKEIVVRNKNGDCIGRLPHVYLKQHFMHVCTVPPLTQQIGPWISINEKS